MKNPRSLSLELFLAWQEIPPLGFLQDTGQDAGRNPEDAVAYLPLQARVSHPNFLSP